MALITVVVHVPNATAEALREAVHQIDGGDAEAVAPENVKGSDVLYNLMEGTLANDFDFVQDSLTNDSVANLRIA
jgi:hypothetical protein